MLIQGRAQGQFFHQQQAKLLFHACVTEMPMSEYGHRSNGQLSSTTNFLGDNFGSIS